MRKLLMVVMVSCAAPWAYAAVIEPAPAVLVLASPGYLQLDGRWYDFDVSTGQPQSSGTRVLAQPIGDGFFIDGFLSARNCQRASGGLLFLTGLLLHSETTLGIPDGSIPLYRRTGPVQVLSSVAVRSCLGETAVLQLTSIHGDLVCSGGISAPYTDEECPPRPNPLIILQGGFEQLPVAP